MRHFLRASAIVFMVACPVHAADHIRVILDVSMSMQNNDKPRLATLATMLLHDLAEPNPPLGDSFEVIPFHRTVEWKNAADPPPTDVGGRIIRRGPRDPFVAAVKRLPYDAKYTYFYPGLRAAISDLESLQSGPFDRKVVVLITDGLPEDSSHTRSREEQAIRDELLPRYRKIGARLYVLAFGGVAAANRAFFDGLISNDVGGFFLDDTGAQLLENMIRIFSRSFGYTAAPPTSFTGSLATLDLEGGQAASRVAVIAFRRASSSPVVRVDPSPNAPGGIQAGEETGASYSLRWVLNPASGSYRFQSDPLGGALAVLRPTRLQIEIRPGVAGHRIDGAIAKVPMPLELVVSPLNGPRGDPGADVNVSYRVCGPRRALDYEWCETDVGGGSGATTPDGRVYRIDPVFDVDPRAPAEFYTGHLEIVAARREAIVGSLRRDRAHRVAVYPFVQLSPQPPGGDLIIDGAARALTGGERGCVPFTFERTGLLPHPARPQYNLRAVLDASLAGDRRFVGATFTLDGRSVDVPSSALPLPATWFPGQALSEAELLGKHELCVQLGKPREGANPVAVPVHFTLLEQPYEGYAVVGSFSAAARVVPPGWLERWGAAIALGALVLLVVVLWVYGRDRPYVPRDLQSAVGSTENGLQPRTMGSGSLLKTLAGGSVWRPLRAERDVLLGWIRPHDSDLYDFWPARGVHVEALGLDSSGRLTVRRAYEARADDGVKYWFGVEYE